MTHALYLRPTCVVTSNLEEVRHSLRVHKVDVWAENVEDDAANAEARELAGLEQG